MATAYKKLAANYTPAGATYNPNDPYGTGALQQPAPTSDPFVQGAYNQLNAPPTSMSDPTLQPQPDQSGIAGVSYQQIAQRSGMTIDQVSAMARDPSQAPILASIAQQLHNQDNNNSVIGGLQLDNSGATAMNQQAQQRIQAAADNQSGLVSGIDSGYGALMGQQSANANVANQGNMAALGQYGQNLGAATGMQVGAYNQLAQTYGGMSQLAPTAFNANMQAQTYNAQNYNAQLANYQTSQAQLSDYQTYQAQLAQYQTYQAQLAAYQNAQLYQAKQQTAESNTGDVVRENEAANQLNDISRGSLNIANGSANPAAFAAQNDALKQYGALTSPEVTAKEKFLYESQRQAQEQQEASSRSALMHEYRLRGAGGSNAELGSILQAGQQNSQNRLLGDLGTQAGAVDRSMQALAGYGGLSTQMTGQANAIAQGNQSLQGAAAGQYGQLSSNIRGQSDNMSTFNAGQGNMVNVANAQMGNSNSQFNANAYNSNQMFNANSVNNASAFNANAYNQNQQFNAGATNDASRFNAGAYNANSINNSQVVTSNNQFNANAYNSNQQFNANSTNQASQFNAGANNQAMQFNTGQINSVNMQNQMQNQMQSHFGDNYRATQQQQAAQRASDLAGMGITVGQNFANNSTSAFNAQTGVQGAMYQRGQDGITLGQQGITADYNARTAGNSAQTGAAGSAIQNTNAATDRGLAIGGLTVGNNNQTSAGITAGLNTSAGGVAAAEAAQAAKDAEGPGGLLGTGILGKHDPLSPGNWFRGSIK